MSIIEDYTAIRSRLDEIEKKPAAKADGAKSLAGGAAEAIAQSWMYYVPENVLDVLKPDDDTAPSEYIFP